MPGGLTRRDIGMILGYKQEIEKLREIMTMLNKNGSDWNVDKNFEVSCDGETVIVANKIAEWRYSLNGASCLYYSIRNRPSHAQYETICRILTLESIKEEVR
jgi:hypothetical protein